MEVTVCHNATYLPENIWVSVEGRKGKTGIQHDQGFDERHGRGAVVKFEDGSTKSVVPGKNDISILPQTPSLVKEVLCKAAQESGCGDSISERLKGLEERDRAIS